MVSPDNITKNFKLGPVVESFEDLYKISQNKRSVFVNDLRGWVKPASVLMHMQAMFVYKLLEEGLIHELERK